MYIYQLAITIKNLNRFWQSFIKMYIYCIDFKWQYNGFDWLRFILNIENIKYLLLYFYFYNHL